MKILLCVQILDAGTFCQLSVFDFDSRTIAVFPADLLALKPTSGHQAE